MFSSFHAVCAEPYACARKAAADGRKVAGYLCTYAPEELLYAAGYLPVRVLGFSPDTQRADGLIQSFSCSLVRAMLDAAIRGDLDFVDLVLFPHTCDTIQNLADIWARHVPDCRYAALATPTGVSGAHAAAFYKSELARLRQLLGNVPDESLAAAVDLYARHRAAMRRLYDVRREHPGLISAADMTALVDSVFLMDRAEHLRRLQALLPLLEARESSSSRSPRIMATGAACYAGAYAAAIEQAGGVVVDDDFCTGSRAFSVGGDDGRGRPSYIDDPLDVLALMYMSRRPCPAKHNAGFHPGAELVRRTRECAADGVVFLLTKFCDPWAFDYPTEREALDAAEIPSVLIEIEPNQAPTGQFATRIAAFVETLKASGRTEAV